MLKITIVGLPNVGKSTLFNRLVGKKTAVVSNVSGVTRDRNEKVGRISNLEFEITDTGGWNNKSDFSLQIIKQVEFSLLRADMVLFLVDARIQDEQNKELAKWLKKKTSKPVVLVANKCESYKSENLDYLQFFDFMGPVYISAECNLGMVDLYDALTCIVRSIDSSSSIISGVVDYLHQKKNELISGLHTKIVPDQANKLAKMKIAIIGRPNVGKSTFLNSFLAENRLITDSKPGTTRDSIDITYYYNGKLITLIDTAGIRRKANIIGSLESKFVEKSIESIKRSHVVILMLDSVVGIKHHDLSISKIAIEKGKGIIFVLNKWDLMSKNDRSNFVCFMKQQIIHLEVSAMTISALKNIRCSNVIDKCLEIGEFLNKKISTAKLNNWLANTLDKHSHPLVNGGRIVKIKYIVQVGTKPPAFSLICNVPEYINESYKRYLINDLRKSFFIKGVPVRLFFKKNKNPYRNNIC
ncbi:MAG: ribosome biogenesis GTPase Der [Wolbachia endosymbiont of Menacanthus eurysternus]|nr:MAG: ribosome biogenesis GTPase Der [Wolbachia endosymbiont of Menacanthus eurysternus]